MSEPIAPDSAPVTLRPIEIATVPKHPYAILVRWLGPPETLLVHHRARAVGLPCGQPWVCSECRRHEAPDWKAYTPALVSQGDGQPWIQSVVVITEALWPSLIGQVLRGQEWLLQKIADRKRWPVTGRRVRSIIPNQLPPPNDVAAFLRRFYNCPELVLGAKNPRPAAQMAAPWKPPEAVAEAAPAAEAPPATEAPPAAEAPPAVLPLATRIELAAGIGAQPTRRNGSSTSYDEAAARMRRGLPPR